MMQLILAATLLMTSLSSIGLVALWAARSPLHWFLRTAVFLAIASMVLGIPAYEPLVAFAVQGATVALGIQLARWRRRKHGRLESDNRRMHFSLQTCLLATVIFAMATAVAVQLPDVGFDGWRNVVLIGMASGIAILLGVWVVCGRRSFWWLRLTAAVIGCLAVSIVVAWLDHSLQSLADPFSTWPPTSGVSSSFGEVYSLTKIFFAWVSILVGIMLVHSAAVWLTRLAILPTSATSRPSSRLRSPTRRIAARGALLVAAILLPAFPAFVYFQLMTPLPIPEPVPASPNGWSEIVAAGRMAERSSGTSTIRDYNTAPPRQLAKAVEALGPVYERLDVALQQPVRRPLEYSMNDISNPSVFDQRSLAQALAAEGRLAEIEGRFRDAADSYMQLIRFGYAGRRGGLLIHSLIGTACSGMGRKHLFQCRTNLSYSDCVEFASSLEQIGNQAEPLEAFVYRERVWQDNAFEWHQRLCQILNDNAPPPDLITSKSLFHDISAREPATMRLLRVELAILAWRIRFGRLPDSLDEMVPEFLTTVPIDPFAPSRTAMQYRPAGDSYLLYSVSKNGVDDGGAPPTEERSIQDGDLRLDVFFAPP